MKINPHHEDALKALEILDKKSSSEKSTSKAKEVENPVMKNYTQIAIIGVLSLIACVIFGTTTGIAFWLISGTSTNINNQVSAAPPIIPTVKSEVPTLEPTPTRIILESPTPTPSTTPSPTPTRGDDVEYIGNLATYKDGDKVQFYFSLYDRDKNYVRASGTVNVRIVNDFGETVFTKTREITESNFDFYTRNLDREEFEAAAFSIPISDIQKSRTSRGIFYLDFTTSDGEAFETIEDTLLSLPEFSDEELEAQSSQYFDQNAILLNVNKRIDNYISVTVHRIGLMPLDTGLGEETYIRVDITVENVGSEKIGYYSPNPVIIGKTSNQFDEALVSRYEYENVFDSGDLYPGVKKSGALFFETRSSNQLDISQLIIETGLSSYYEESRTIGDGQALLFDKEYVFVFDVSNIQLR